MRIRVSILAGKQQGRGVWREFMRPGEVQAIKRDPMITDLRQSSGKRTDSGAKSTNDDQNAAEERDDLVRRLLEAAADRHAQSG